MNDGASPCVERSNISSISTTSLQNTGFANCVRSSWENHPSPFQLKYDVAQALRQVLDDWALPFKGCYNAHYHYAFQIQRFHVWAYWRPMTVSRYERMTLDYRGPYLPIFASRTEYLDDEQYVYEGFDFNMRAHHHYKTVPFYFVLPGFLLNPPLPKEREWRWHPAVRVSRSIAKQVLTREAQNGGWTRNRRGLLQIPRVTGCSGVDPTVQNGEGWASFSGGGSLTPSGDFQ